MPTSGIRLSHPFHCDFLISLMLKTLSGSKGTRFDILAPQIKSGLPPVVKTNFDERQTWSNEHQGQALEIQVYLLSLRVWKSEQENKPSHLQRSAWRELILWRLRFIFPHYSDRATLAEDLLASSLPREARPLFGLLNWWVNQRGIALLIINIPLSQRREGEKKKRDQIKQAKWIRMTLVCVQQRAREVRWISMRDHVFVHGLQLHGPLC